MSLLIINISSDCGSKIQDTISMLTKSIPEHRVINASSLNIHPCTGCCTCMLVTPGQCCIQDDFEEILKACLCYEHILFVADTALGFINHKAKNLIDRMFPLVNILTRFHDGQILHIPRYEHSFQITLIYNGNADHEFLTTWLDRFGKNMTAQPLGVFSIQDIQEVLKCIL